MKRLIERQLDRMLKVNPLPLPFLVLVVLAPHTSIGLLSGSLAKKILEKVRMRARCSKQVFKVLWIDRSIGMILVGC